MANAIAGVLDGLSDKELDSLAAALADRFKAQRRINYDTMSDMQRRLVNVTVHPMTHKTVHIEYPKILYGLKEGVLQSAEVDSAEEEVRLKAQFGSYDWKGSPLAHGIETLPSIGQGFSIRPFDALHAPVGLPEGLAPAAFAAAAIEAAKRKPGRPKKVA